MNFRMIWMGSDDEDDDGQNPPANPLIPKAASRVRYEEQEGVLVRVDAARVGRPRYTPLTNFTARIASDVVLDDGEEGRREFTLEASLRGEALAFRVLATEFGRMHWVLRRLGPQAIVYPGQSQHARTAIQAISRDIQQERIFTHLGWRKQGEQWRYLHAGGALGADGLRSDLQVQLTSALARCELRPGRDSQEKMQSIHASLRCLRLAPDHITVPLVAAIYRAPFGNTDFSLFLAGKTGVFKTAIAAVAQQHFGAGLDAAHLPGHFGSTANALESLAFEGKDALLVIDDYAPTGRYGDDHLENVAERLFRAAGNQQGRSRMAGNGRVKSPRPPRALLMATGEDVPRAHSIRARLLVIEVAPGEVDLPTLSECQRAGDDGTLAAAMAAYVQWIAGRYEELQDRIRTRSLEIRAEGRGRAVHARLPAALAELQSGFEVWLEFAVEQGTISAAERTEWRQRSERAFQELAGRQARYHQASDPVLRFIRLLQSAITSGRAHFAHRSGAAPESAQLWGWQRRSDDQGWTPYGTRIGWVMGDDVFLEPTVSYQVAQELAGTEPLPVSQQTLHHRLRESGLLASVDANRQMVQVRRMLEGCSRQVLHLRAKDFMQSSEEVGP